MNVEIMMADYSHDQHKLDIPILLNMYASDPMGGGEDLSVKVLDALVSELAKRPHACSVLAYVDGKAAGLVNCFEGFSTFFCKPIMNVHDVMVVDKYRRLQISSLMLEKVEEMARERGCCKMTLEVLSNNEVAKAAYRKFGFSDYALDPEMGTALFWEKLIAG